MPSLLVLRSRLLLLPLVALSLVVACGDDGGDVQGPAVVSIFPSAAAGAQDRDVVLQVVYDGPVRVGTGQATAETAGGDPVSGLGIAFTADPNAISINPPGGRWPAGTTITATISNVGGENGGTAEEAVIVFETIDDERPTVVEFRPENRGVVTDVRSLVAFQIEFSEPMNTAAGSIEQIEPTSAEWFDIDARTWSEDGTVLTVPRLGDGVIPYDERYRFNLSNFVDDSGNLVDPETQAYLFDTGDDNQAPRVIRSMPVEGQTDVDPQLGEVLVRFDEQMNEIRRQARLEADGEDLGTVTGNWDGAGREITFSLVDGDGVTLLRQSAPHRLVLTNLQDREGNPPSADPMLGGDGALDFTTGVDESTPGVVSVTGVIDVDGIETDVDFAEPVMNVDYPVLLRIEVQFTETMDPSSVAEFEIEADGESQVIGHTWDLADTLLVFDASTVTLEATTFYAIDLGGVTDTSGNALGAESLGDNNLLEFNTRAPSGENCTEPLSIRDASLADGVYTWAVLTGSATMDDGGTDDCDTDGSGADLVIRYEKTTPSLSADPTAGRLLRVRTEASSTGEDGYNLQVLRGACAPTDAAAESLHCVTGQALDEEGMPIEGRDLWEKELDLGPGTYFLWLSAPVDALPAGEISVEEVTAPTEGESCLDPYDDGSLTYFPPIEDDDPAVWSIPTASANGVDRTRTNAAAFDCDGVNPSNVGVDVVIEIEKAAAASYLEVTVDAPASRVNILGACDAEATEAVAFCSEGADDHVFRGGAFLPAGPVYVWVAADRPADALPAVNVEVLEVDIDTGEGCQAANPIAAAGTVDIDGTLDSTEALDVPGCFTGGGNVEWWSYTAGDEVVSFDPDRTTRLAVVDQATGQVISCDEFAGDYALGAIVESGDTVCIAVPVTSNARQLTVDDTTYTGVAGTRSDLSVTLPSGFTVIEDRFLEDDTDDLYFGVFTTTSPAGARVLELPKTGGAAVERGSTDGVTTSTAGRAGVVVDGELFSANTSRASSGSRIFQLYDGTGWDGAVEWDDPAPAWPVDLVGVLIGTLATDGTDLWFALLRDTFATPEDTRFYSLGAASAGAPTNEGDNINVYGVRSLAVDDTYLYFTGILDNGDRSGVYRVTKADPSATPTRLSPALTFREPLPTGLELDDDTDPEYLYVRTSDPPAIQVIQNPDGATPAYLGAIADVSSTGGTMAYDEAAGVLYVYEADGGTPTFVKIE